MQKAVYIFCLCRADGVPGIEGCGVDKESPLFLRTFRKLVALASHVSLADFVGPEAEMRLKDVNWVGPRAMRHEEVVEQVMRHTPIFPASFGTLFSSSGKLDLFLRTHYKAIISFLNACGDSEEWALKGFLDKENVKENIFRHLLANQAGQLDSSPGKRYFQEKRLRSGLETAFQVWLKESLERVLSALMRDGIEFRERRIFSRDTTGADLDMVFNGAFFVPRRQMQDFQKGIENLNETFGSKLHLELSGPWPPYSFTPILEMKETKG